MNGKEKIISAIAKSDIGGVPVDFGGTAQTGIHISCIASLREYLGLDIHPIKVVEPYQMLGEIEDDLKEILGIDTMHISAGGTMFGFKNENWKKWKTPWGQTVLVPGMFNTTMDEKGDVFIYPEGDTSVMPSAKMPASSFFFDAIARQGCFDENNPNPYDNTEEFSIITDQEVDYWKNMALELKGSDKAVIANLIVTGFGDVAMVPGVNLKNPKGIRDITEWYMSTLIRPEYIHQVFEIQSDIAIENLKILAPILNEVIDGIYISGTDFGTQNSTFCDEETYRTLYLPYYKKVNDWIHAHTNWKTFMHSCGAIKSLIPAIIDSGFDLLNPVQCSATGMDPVELKKEFGQDIVFWGGGIDTQKTLPFGTPEEVTKEVLYRCEVFSKNGGFVFSSIHNIQAGTPVENIVAMFNAVKEFNEKRKVS